MGIKNWNAGIIRPVPVAPTGPYQNSSAPGVWTIDQQAYWQKQGVWPTAGNVDPSAFIENLFSTYLYTGTGSAQTITNGINLSGQGGLVWLKSRSLANPHWLFDTSRGIYNYLKTNTTDSQNTSNTSLTAFNSNGFSIGNDTEISTNGATQVSWTFRKQPKFFDVVTYTGDGTTPRNINHNLGSVPGCIIIKNLTTAQAWPVYHRSLNITGGFAMTLNTTDATASSGVLPQFFASTLATSTQFTVGNASAVNNSGNTFVAYLFAHDAGGFGLTGTDNVISCGSFASTGAVVNVTLGYEPQFLLVKRTDAADDWRIIDSMRGFTTDKNDQILAPNLSAAETNLNPYIGPTATGFSTAAITAGRTYIYIAIRRGPMAVPTLGTSVYAGQLQSPPGGSYTLAANSGFPIDMLISRVTASIQSCYTFTRLQGNEYLATASTAAAGSATYGWDKMAGVTAAWDASASTVSWAFRRAPGVMDVVCYVGAGADNVYHNLTVVPEMIITKGRSNAANWAVYHKDLGNTKGLNLNTTGAVQSPVYWWYAATPQATVYQVGGDTTGPGGTNPYTSAVGVTYVAYLFATCAGVSKVGSYTGTAALQTVACGFTTGARFVLIKRTDSTGDWYVWDSARGITSGNDPYLLLNSTAAEVTGTNYVDTDVTGFKVTAAAPAGINASGGTYIFLAIA